MTMPEQAPTLDEMQPPTDPEERYREAAVLLLSYPRGVESHIVFMKRTDTVVHHKGQISLPGGARDETDPDLIFTALREAQEELGIDPRFVEVIGTMPPIYARVSGFMITPVVGRLMGGSSELLFVPNPHEVAEVIEVPLRVLRDPTTHTERPVEFQGARYNLHTYTYGPYEIWGATGRILYEFFKHPLARRLEADS
jgi:8-oxo-dGTP pyrophosphatase MutT (NUDIX family)